MLAAILSLATGSIPDSSSSREVPLKEGSEEISIRRSTVASRNEGQPTRPLHHTINDIRKKHPALSELTNLHFHPTDKDAIIAFSKTSPGEAQILGIVNLNPWHWEEATVELDLDVLGLDPSDPFEVHDLITDTTYVWHGAWNYVRLDPQEEPAHIFRIGR